jgi:hypothetical protein
MSSAIEPHLPESLRLKLCPDCGYSLTGLPVEGQCPECGFKYHSDIIVLYGWATGPHASVANARPWRAAWLAFPALLYILLQLLIGTPRSYPLSFIIICGAWVVPLAYGLWRRSRSIAEKMPPTQLRLQPDGFAQRDGSGPPPLTLWQPNQEVAIAHNIRLQVNVKREPKPWWKFVKNEFLVQFECEAPPETANDLRETLERWGIIGRKKHSASSEETLLRARMRQQ